MDFMPLDDSDPVVQLFEKETATANLARELMDQHGLYDWTFKISRAIRTLGHCDRRRKEIVYSKNFMHLDDSEIRDTILHEIAHALTPKDRGHGLEWKMKCVEIGARPERLADVTPPDIPKKFYLECSGCGKRWWRHRLKRNMIGRLSSCCSQPLKGYRIK